jgi:hypothetical protein
MGLPNLLLLEPHTYANAALRQVADCLNLSAKTITKCRGPAQGRA